MNNEDTETLFSFEVHVERIEELSARCRLPAVSFRLLDFPTLIIHHLSPSAAEKMRQKVEMKTVPIDALLSELKDGHNNFQMKKGKSCLLKVNLNDLHSHLQTVPMYVMLIDLWPTKPKLVGSTTVVLKDAINKIHREISRNGIAMPAFYREENTFSVYNLMGSVVAKVKLGYRLLSLGGALLAHVPRWSLRNRESDKENYKAKPTVDAHDISSRVEKKKHPIEVPPKPHLSVNLTEKQNVHVQTDENKTQNRNNNTAVTDTNDDFFVTNIVCPPPLYYNFHSDTQPNTVGKGGKLNEDVKRKQTQKSVSLLKPESPHDVQSTDVDFEYCDPVVIPKDQTVMKSCVAVQTDTHLMVKGHESTKHGDQSIESEDKCFPLLSALLKELTSVPNIKKSPKSTRVKETIQNKCGEKNVSSVVKMKPLTVSSGKKLIDSCRVQSRGKSAVIGLPRERPRFCKSNLTYKMTKTQLMRLEMNQRAVQGREKSKRLCVAWAKDAEGKTRKQKPSSVNATFGDTVKTNLKQDVTGEREVLENGTTTTKQFISAEMQTEGEDVFLCVLINVSIKKDQRLLFLTNLFIICLCLLIEIVFTFELVCYYLVYLKTDYLPFEVSVAFAKKLILEDKNKITCSQKLVHLFRE